MLLPTYAPNGVSMAIRERKGRFNLGGNKAAKEYWAEVVSLP
jgi:hypothetical protein